jgi:hypothetical protein
MINQRYIFIACLMTYCVFGSWELGAGSWDILIMNREPIRLLVSFIIEAG